MQQKVSQLWTLMKRSQIAKKQLSFVLLLSIIEVAAGWPPFNDEAN